MRGVACSRATHMHNPGFASTFVRRGLIGAHMPTTAPISRPKACAPIRPRPRLRARARPPAQPAAAAPNAVEKKKLWDAVQPLLRTDAARVASCGGLQLNTSAGPLTAATLTGARIA